MSDLVELTCHQCGKSKHITRKDYLTKVRRGTKKFFCDNQCQGKGQEKLLTLPCGFCKKPVVRTAKLQQDSKSGHIFCNRSCSISYHNAHKTKGYRRSKLEIWVEAEFRKHYPNLDLYANHRGAIDGELDLYFPSLKLAFEFNGILHYQPIYGTEKLSTIQHIDKRKLQECAEKEISLHVFDVSHVKHFTPKLGELLYPEFRVHIERVLSLRLQQGWSIESSDPTRGYKGSTHQSFKPRKRKPQPRKPRKPPSFKVLRELEKALRWDAEIQSGEATREQIAFREGLPRGTFAKIMCLRHLSAEVQRSLQAREETYGRLSINNAVRLSKRTPSGGVEPPLTDSYSVVVSV